MFSKSIREEFIAVITILAVLLIGGASTAASAMSVDVKNLSYSDDSNRAVLYNFSAGTVSGNAIELSGLAGVVTPPSGETGVTYFWGRAPSIPPVAVTLDTENGKATVSPASAGADGVAVLFAGPGVLPAGADPVSWSYSLNLNNFSVDLTAQKAYQFDTGLGRDENAGGPYNNATLSVIWVKGFYSGTLYPENTLIIRARVENGDSEYWVTPTPIVRTGLDPAATTLAIDLAVTGGNHFTVAVNINGEGATSLGEYTLTAGQGSFQRLPDLYPYVSMNERSASTALQAAVQSFHFQSNDKYYAGFFVQDPLHLASAVRVTGDGNSYVGSGVDLSWDETQKSWLSLQSHEIGTTPVTAPYPSFIFTFTPQPGGAAIDPVTRAITGYVTEFATNLIPQGNVSTNPVFTWTAPAGGAGGYVIELNDGPTRIWNKYNVPALQTSVVYDGPPLVNGKTYNYNINSNIEQSGVWNVSLANGSFTFTGTASGAITVSGIARDWSGNVIPAPGVTVALVGDATKTTTASTADGSFSLSGVPGNTPFALKLSRTGYLDVYSPNISAGGNINLNVSATGSTPFNMPTTANLTAFGALPAAGKGLMAGRVADATYRYSATVGGVFLTAAGGSKSYPVYYRDPFFGGLSQGGMTWGNGLYYVLNVDGSDTVILSASKQGWLFNTLTFGTHADSVSMGRIYGTAPGFVTMNGSVLNTAGAGIAGARLELNGDGGKFTNTAGDGSYWFSGLPQDANFYVKTTAAGYAPHYASVNLPGSFSGINITLRTEEEMAGAGVTGGHGLIACKVTDMSLNALSGAVVTLQSKSGTVYTPVYPGGSGSTSATGFFLVPNIQPGDVVQISVAKAGYGFGYVLLDGFSGAVTGKIIAGGTPVVYNSYISDKDTVGVAGVAVEQVGAANSTTSSASPAGAFGLNVPYGLSFYLRFSKTGFADTYSAEITTSAPVNDIIGNGFTLQASTRLAEWSVASGKGVIRSRVKDPAGSNIAGAVVHYTSRQGRTYTVCYDDACTPSMTSTQGSSGRYMIKNVEPGDIVIVTARKSGYTFNTRVFHIYADSVHQGGITGANLVNISATGQGFSTSSAGTGSVNVTAPGSVSWTAISNDAWITVTAGASGTGNGTVNFSVSANTGAASRTGTITIGDRTFTITQAGTPLSDEELIDAAFQATLTEFNKGASGSISIVMSHFSANYLNDGKNFAAWQTEMQAAMAQIPFQPKSVLNSTITVNGSSAVMVVNWSDGSTENLYWAKEGDSVWRIAGNGNPYNAPWAGSHHNQDGQYYGDFVVSDPNHLLQSVAVTGPGIDGTLQLTYRPDAGAWWAVPSQVLYGATPPANAQYQIVMTGPSGAYTYPVTINGGVADFATALTPFGNVSGALTFGFTGIAGANYMVHLLDAGGLHVWQSPQSPSTSVGYTGPALASGMYNYLVHSFIGENSSVTYGQFTYTGGPTISFNGWAKAVPNWPSTEGATGVAGTTVSALSPATVPATLINSVTADSSTGAFSLTGLPTASTFYLKVQPPEGYKPVLGRLINWNADIQASLPYGLFTTGQYATFSNTPGTGMVLGRVALKTDTPPATTFLAGATIEAREWTAGNPPVLGSYLPVTYLGGGSATGADGVYMVKNVAAGKMVQLTATLGGYSFEFNNAVVPVSADTVSEESFFGTAVQQQGPFYVYSYHHQSGTYYINLFLEDASHVYTGVTVNGPGLAGEVSLVYGGGRWALADAGGFSLGTTLPTGARTYNFTAATGGAPVTGSKTVSVYVENFATNLLPAGNITASPTFSWTGVEGAAHYAVVLYDQTAGGAVIWTSPQVTAPQASVAYDGPALTAGHAYRYLVVSTVNTDGNGNASFAEGQFTYSQPSEELIDAAFRAAMAAYNAKDLTTLMTCFSAAYLESGRNRDAMQAMFIQEFTNNPNWTPRPTSFVMATTANGATAVSIVTWPDTTREKWFFIQEGSDWKIYGNQEKYEAKASSSHVGANYYGSIDVLDPGHAIQSVRITGSGLSQPVYLTWSSATGGWNAWQFANYGTAPPANAVYDVQIVDGTGTYTYQRVINGGIAGFPTNLAPTGAVAGNIVFTFTAAQGAARYTVSVYPQGQPGNSIWYVHGVSGTSVSYAGPALTPGAGYGYDVVAEFQTENGRNNSMASAQFTYWGGVTVSFTGYVVDSQSPSQDIAGATVEQGGVPANRTSTDAAGLYTLGNLQAGLPFYLKIFKDASFAPCYSAEMTYTADRADPRDRAFTLFPATRLGPGAGNWNLEAGKGIIRAHVRDKLDNYIAGVVVTATGLLQQSYPVCYDDDCTPSLTATKDGNGAGRYVIKNVLDGDTVTVTAAKAGWTFNTRVYHTFAGGVSQGRITAQGPVSLTVTAVTNAGGSPVQGVQLQVVGFPSVSSTTGANGSATVTGLPPNTTIPFSLGKTGYVNSYGMFSMASGTYSTRVPVFTQASLTAWGVQAGKGVIYGRLIDNANPDDSTNSLTGVQVQCTSALGKSYGVVYVNADWSIASGATTTLGSGRYLILNVTPGDTVTVSARKAGWSFWSNKVRGYADGVSYGYLRGTAGNATVTMYVTDKNSAAIAGATVQVAENTALSTTTDGSGKATLANLPLDTPLTFEVIKSGYRNTYSRNVILTGHNNNWGTYTLYALDDAVSLGGIPANRGVIHGWVKMDVDGSNLAGAQVTYGSNLGNSYTVAYLNNDHTIATGATATSSNGRFAILGVEPGDTVTATAHLAGWSFEPRTYTARANAVNQSGIYGVVEVLKGDLDGNDVLNLADGIIAAKVISGLTPAVRDDYVTSGADANNDGKIGSADLIFILQRLAEMR